MKQVWEGDVLGFGPCRVVVDGFSGPDAFTVGGTTVPIYGREREMIINDAVRQLLARRQESSDIIEDLIALLDEHDIPLGEAIWKKLGWKQRLS